MTSSLVSLVHSYSCHSPSQTVWSSPVWVVAITSTHPVTEPDLVSQSHHHLVTPGSSTAGVSQGAMSQGHPVPHHPCTTQLQFYQSHNIHIISL